MAAEALLESYLSVIVAAICFGVMYVPVKGCQIYDGTVFQWHLCSGILFAGIVLGTFCEGDFPRGNIAGIIGGGCWAISNMAVIPLVKFIGLGVGFALYHAVNLFTGYVVGRLGVFAALGIPADAGTVPWLRDAGALLLLLSFFIMVFVEPVAEDGSGKLLEAGGAASNPDASQIEMSEMPASGRKKKGYALPGRGTDAPELETVCLASAELVGNRVDNPDSSGGDGEEPASQPDSAPEPNGKEDNLSNVAVYESESEPAQPSRALSGCLLKLLGMMLALFAGTFCGVNAVPFDLWRIKHPAKWKGAFVFPQALGIWIVSTVVYLGYALFQRSVQKTWPPQPLIMPAFISGCVWSAGFVFMCVGIQGIGWTAAYTFDAIGPVFVASLLAVFWFREITDRLQLRLFVFCCLVQAVGVGLIAMGT